MCERERKPVPINRSTARPTGQCEGSSAITSPVVSGIRTELIRARLTLGIPAWFDCIVEGLARDSGDEKEKKDSQHVACGYHLRYSDHKMGRANFL